MASTEEKRTDGFCHIGKSYPYPRLRVRNVRPSKKKPSEVLNSQYFTVKTSFPVSNLLHKFRGSGYG